MKFFKLLFVLLFLLPPHPAIAAEPFSEQDAADLFVNEMARILDIHLSGDAASLADDAHFTGLVQDEQSGSFVFTSRAFLEATGKKLTCLKYPDRAEIQLTEPWEDASQQIADALERSGMIPYALRGGDNAEALIFRRPELEFTDSYYEILLIVQKESETQVVVLAYIERDRTREVQQFYNPYAAWGLGTSPDGSAYRAGVTLSALAEGGTDIFGEHSLEIRQEGDGFVMALTSELYPKWPAIDPAQKARGVIRKLLSVRIDDTELPIEPSEVSLTPNAGVDTLAFPVSSEVLGQMAEGRYIQFDFLTLLDEHVQLVFPLEDALKNLKSIIELNQIAAVSPTIARVLVRDYAGVENDIANGVDVNKALPDGRTALHFATSLGDLEMIRLLGTHPDLDTEAKDGQGVPCIDMAIEKEEAPEILEALLSIGCDPDVRIHPFYAYTPLMLTSGNLEQMKLLIDAGADVNAADFNGQTPLHYMVMAADALPAQIDLLIESGADPNRQADDGDTPLITAVENMCWDQIDALLAAGADPGIRNDEGLTALEIARSRAEQLAEAGYGFYGEIPASLGDNYEAVVRKLEKSYR